MGPMFKAGRYDMPVRSVDVAPTLAAATDVTPIEAVDGRVLREAIIGLARSPQSPVRPKK